MMVTEERRKLLCGTPAGRLGSGRRGGRDITRSIKAAYGGSGELARVLTGSCRVTLLRIRDSYNIGPIQFRGNGVPGSRIGSSDESGLHLNRQSSNRRLCNGFHKIR